MKRFISILLSLTLALFILDGLISLGDTLLVLTIGSHAISGLRGMCFFLSTVLVFGSYLVLGFSPMVSRRLFLPMILLNPLSLLLALPVTIYFYKQILWLDFLFSLVQILVGGWTLRRVVGKIGWQWPLVTQEQLGTRVFSLFRAVVFVLVNCLVCIPGIVIYLAVCAATAVDHFSEGFIALKPSGFVLRAKTFTRNDGKVVHLIPMMHIGESSFYEIVDKSIPTNAIVLMEGVSDEKHLLQEKLSYKKLASSLGLSEQKSEFVPKHGETRVADLDIQDFSKETRKFLEMTAKLYSQGLDLERLLRYSQESQDPALVDHLLNDILAKRNQHLLGEIKLELKKWDRIVVPWGAMHMPGVSKGIKEAGFTVQSSEEHPVLLFRNLLRQKAAK